MITIGALQDKDGQNVTEGKIISVRDKDEGDTKVSVYL